jgi:hypothetical protein
VRQVSLPLVTTPSERSVAGKVVEWRDGVIDRSIGNSATPVPLGGVAGSGRALFVGVFMREAVRAEG